MAFGVGIGDVIAVASLICKTGLQLKLSVVEGLDLPLKDLEYEFTQLQRVLQALPDHYGLEPHHQKRLQDLINEIRNTIEKANDLKSYAEEHSFAQKAKNVLTDWAGFDRLVTGVKDHAMWARNLARDINRAYWEWTVHGTYFRPRLAAITQAGQHEYSPGLEVRNVIIDRSTQTPLQLFQNDENPTSERVRPDVASVEFMPEVDGHIYTVMAAPRGYQEIAGSEDLSSCRNSFNPTQSQWGSANGRLLYETSTDCGDREGLFDISEHEHSNKTSGTPLPKYDLLFDYNSIGWGPFSDLSKGNSRDPPPIFDFLPMGIKTSPDHHWASPFEEETWGAEFAADAPALHS